MLMPFAVQFTKLSGSQQIAATGLTVTFTLIQVKLSDGSITTLVNNQPATPAGLGEYFYIYSGVLDFTTYFYLANFTTTDTTVQLKDIGGAFFDFSLSLSKNLDGVSLVPTGLDAVMVANKSLPHALQIIGATTAGKVTGAGSGTEVFYDFAGAICVTVTTDSSGDRPTVVYSV